MLPMGKAYTCLPAVTEASYLLRRYPKFRKDLIQSVMSGEFSLLSVEADELSAVLDVFAIYHDQDVDFADAVLLYLANREAIDVVFTLDRRHFSLFRKDNGQPLRLLPEVL